MTRLTQRMFDVPVALVSIVEEDKDRQFFKSQIGLAEPWASKRQTPLSHSFCQYVKRDNEALVVEDARQHALVRTNLAVSELSVVSYLGVPVRDPWDNPVGALCVIDSTPRKWKAGDITILTDLARCVSTEIAIRSALKLSVDLYSDLQNEHDRTKRHNRMRETIAQAFMMPDLTIEQRFEALLRSTCQMLDLETGAIVRIDGDELQTVFSTGNRSEGSSIPLDQALARDVMAGQEIVQHPVGASGRRLGRTNAIGEPVQAYAGVPLIMNGVMYGVIEFSSASPRKVALTDEDLSILSIVSMFSCGHLSVFGQLKKLKAAEHSALMKAAEAVRVATNGIRAGSQLSD